MMKPLKAIGAAMVIALTVGCVSIGGDVETPDSLLTLTSSAQAQAGSASDGDLSNALAVLEPSTPQRLDIVRIPVRVNDSSIAYLQDAFWVEKPARLFQRVLAETIRAGGNRLVIGGGDLDHAAATSLTGQLTAMDYDSSASSVLMRYDAVLRLPDGTVRTQRFESTVSGVLPDAMSVGPAMNEAANDIAAQVAQWVG